MSKSNEIFEWRGVSDLVCAELLSDDADSLTYGPVFPVIPVAEIGRTTENASEAHYYDNKPLIVIDSTGADTVTVTGSAIPLDVFGKITGQNYDEMTGALIEGEREAKYFALGYKTKKSNGKEVYVWRYKGKFSIPDSTHSTETAGTEANGQEITYTGINTTHKFSKNKNRSAKAFNVDTEKAYCDTSTFFDTVTTPDTITSLRCIAPTATPTSGEVESGATVVLATTTTGADIFYTTDGTDPTENSTEYTDAIAITSATTIKCFAHKADMVDSPIAEFTYTV